MLQRVRLLPLLLTSPVCFACAVASGLSVQEALVDSLQAASLACLDCSFGIKEQVIVPKVHACSHCCSLHAVAEVVITCSSDQHVSHNLIWSNVRQHPEDICKAKQCTGTATCLQYLPEGDWWEF